MVLPVVTKCDLLSATEISQVDKTSVCTSSVDHVGVEKLWSRIDQAVEKFELNKAVSLGVVLNERHRFKLESSRAELELLLDEFRHSQTTPGDEVVGTLLASILAQLGEISGRVFSEQLLESVFSRFCIGK